MIEFLLRKEKREFSEFFERQSIYFVELKIKKKKRRNREKYLKGIRLLQTKTGQQPRYKCICRAVFNERVTAIITARGRYWAIRWADL